MTVRIENVYVSRWMVCIAVVTGKIVRGYQILWLYELQKFHRSSVYLCHVSNDVPKVRNATVRLTMPILLSVCPSATNNLSRNVCVSFENVTWILIFHWNLLTIASAINYFHSTVLDYVTVLKVKQSHYRPDRPWGFRRLRLTNWKTIGTWRW